MKQMQALNDHRLYSLDFFRGLTMFVLIAEFSHIFSYLVSPELEGSFIFSLGTQFHHAEWTGMHFWDLIQPFFMFIVGVAMPLSFSRRIKNGASYHQLLKHVLKRAFLLLLFGWAVCTVFIPQVLGLSFRMCWHSCR